MKEAKFLQIVDHLWSHRDYLKFHPQFDFPFYGGLKSKMDGVSSEGVDAMQNIWHDFTSTYKSKPEFRRCYEIELYRLGEQITNRRKK